MASQQYLKTAEHWEQEGPSLPMDSSHLSYTYSEWLLSIAMAQDYTVMSSVRKHWSLQVGPSPSLSKGTD